MKIVLATHNKNKLKEFSRILAPLDVEIVSQNDIGIDIEAIENGKTFSDNSKIKAKTVFDVANMVTIADDSGICIDAFDGAPGVFSARFLGEDTPYNIKNNIILEKMSSVEEKDRTARYVCSICCIFPNGKVITVEDKCEGYIGYKPMGDNGFGYDPIFYVGDKSMAQISDDEKDTISHRGKALRKFYAELKKYLSEEKNNDK